ncbi:MAG: hypothetical protein K1W10_07135 [Lachnospiraceae bacterium]
MGKLKRQMIGILLCGSIMLNACSNGAVEEDRGSRLSVKETVQSTMESLKELDLERFNEYTDNYVETYHNWIGIPVEREYRVFSELQQPGLKMGKWKRKEAFNRKVCEKMMEQLTWEIGEVKEEGNRAQIEMKITNLNMADVMGKYELSVWEKMLESTGTGLGQMVKEFASIMDEDEGLLAVMETCDEKDLITFEVTVTAFREQEAWKLHLDDDFINAFMGNINAEEYSEELQQKITELEEKQEEKLEEWEEDFTDRIERWFE